MVVGLFSIGSHGFLAPLSRIQYTYPINLVNKLRRIQHRCAGLTIEGPFSCVAQSVVRRIVWSVESSHPMNIPEAVIRGASPALFYTGFNEYPDR